MMIANLVVTSLLSVLLITLPAFRIPEKMTYWLRLTVCVITMLSGVNICKETLGLPWTGAMAMTAAWLILLFLTSRRIFSHKQ